MNIMNLFIIEKTNKFFLKKFNLKKEKTSKVIKNK